MYGYDIIGIASSNLTTWFGILLYWMPLVLCFYGYTLRTWKNIQYEKKARSEADYYTPSETVGTLMARLLYTIVPVVNLFAAIFDVSPEVFKSFLSWLRDVFSFPLVPDKEMYKEKRLQKRRDREGRPGVYP